MSEKKENREDGKEKSSSRSGLTDEQIEAALNACTFGYLREKCRNCPLDSEKEPCITNLHLAALAYISRLKNRAEGAETALRCLARSFEEAMCKNGNAQYLIDGFIKDAYKQAEKELSEEREDENI